MHARYTIETKKVAREEKIQWVSEVPVVNKEIWKFPSVGKLFLLSSSKYGESLCTEWDCNFVDGFDIDLKTELEQHWKTFERPSVFFTRGNLYFIFFSYDMILLVIWWLYSKMEQNTSFIQLYERSVLLRFTCSRKNKAKAF